MEFFDRQPELMDENGNVSGEPEAGFLLEIDLQGFGNREVETKASFRSVPELRCNKFFRTETLSNCLTA